MIALETKAARTTGLHPVRPKIAVQISMGNSSVLMADVSRKVCSVTEMTIVETMKTKAEISALN